MLGDRPSSPMGARGPGHPGRLGARVPRGKRADQEESIDTLEALGQAEAI